MEITKEIKIGAEAVCANTQRLQSRAFMYGELLGLMEIDECITPTDLCVRYSQKKEDFLADGKDYWDWIEMGNRRSITPSYAGCWAKAMEKAGYIKREKKPIEPYTIKLSSWGHIITEPQNCFEVENEITIDTQMYYTRIK